MHNLRHRHQFALQQIRQRKLLATRALSLLGGFRVFLLSLVFLDRLISWRSFGTWRSCAVISIIYPELEDAVMAFTWRIDASFSLLANDHSCLSTTHPHPTAAGMGHAVSWTLELGQLGLKKGQTAAGLHGNPAANWAHH